MRLGGVGFAVVFVRLAAFGLLGVFVFAAFVDDEAFVEQVEVHARVRAAAVDYQRLADRGDPQGVVGTCSR